MSAITSDLSGWTGYLAPPLDEEGSRRALALALLGGVAFDTGLRGGIDSVAGALAVAAGAAVLLASGRLRTAHARIIVAAAPVFGVWLAIRATPWLLPFDIVASAALLVLGASLGSGGSLLDVSIPAAIARAMQSIVQALFVPAFVIQSVDTARSKAWRIVRGIVIAVPLVVVLIALFASADAVFARAVHLNVANAIRHAVAIGVGAFGMAWLLRLASVRSVDVPEIDGPSLAPVEWTIVLGALDVVLAGFAVAQAIALSSGGKHLLHSAGFTYAQYARSGFFQLLAAIVITGGSLMALHVSAGEGRVRSRFRVLANVAVALTFVVVVSAYHRLALYEQVYGMTMLRFYVHIAIVASGILLALLTLRIAGLGGGRPWLAPVAGIVVLATLLGLNVLNPEAFVARYNLTHRSAHFDPAYLGHLSPDAAPALANTKEICGIMSGGRSGWAAFNLSRYRAQSLRKESCR